MKINNKVIAIASLSAIVGLTAMTSLKQSQPRVDPPLQNIRVLSKKLTYRQVDHIMDEWAHSLGVRCNFCHARNEELNKMDFASDAKPEKLMAREMFKMMGDINKKYFKAGKDSLDMVMTTGVNCYTCHNGKAHPEVVVAPVPARRNGPPPGGTLNGEIRPGTPPPGGR